MRHAPVAREHQPLGDLDAEVAVGIEPERAQHRLEFRLRHDAGAAPGERLGGALVDLDVPPAPRKRERGEQPAHRSADHQRPHVSSPSAFLPPAQNLL